jgi:hypothetical protein
MPVEVKGAIELRKALRDYAPDLAKKLNLEMASALKPIVAEARGFMPSVSPLSGWAPRDNSKGKFPTYDGKVAKAGVKYKVSPSKKNRQGFRSLAQVKNASAAGAIYETAGRKNPGGKFSPKLGGSLEGRDKMRGRAIYRAWEQDQGKANTAVIRAIESAGKAFEAKGMIFRKAKR